MKTKMAVAVSTVFLLFAAALAHFALKYFADAYKKAVSHDLVLMATALAENIDNRLDIARDALRAAGANLPPPVIADPDAAQRFLDERVTLHSLFPDEIFLIARNGRVIAEHSRHPGKKGADFSGSDFFTTAMARKKPSIATPSLSELKDESFKIFLSIPVVNRKGEAIALLTGSLDLLGWNSIENVLRTRIGPSGHLCIFGRDRTYLVHRADDIRGEKIPAEVTPLFDRALAVGQATGETVDCNGTPVLASFHQLRSTDWLIAINYPLADAYAPLKNAKHYFLAAIALSSIIVLTITWLLMQRLTTPLVKITRHLEALPELVPEKKRLCLDGNDEIGRMAAAFNNMVTALEQQQATLLESETNFRAIAEAASDGMLVIAGEARFVFANRRIADMTGYSVAELQGMGIEDLATPEALAAVMERFANIVARQEIPRQYETHLVRKDRDLVPVEVTSAFTAWQGAPADLVIMRDITDRRRTEKALRDSYTLLQNTFASLNEAVFIVETGTRRILDYNDAVKDMFGYARGELIGASTSCLHVDEEMSRRFGETMLKAYEDHGYFETTYRMKRRNGTVFDSEHYVTPIYDDDSRITSHVCVVRDISERKRVEERLRESEEKFRNLVETTSDLVWETDERGAYTYTSPRLHDILGYEPGEVIGKTPFDFMPPEEARRVAGIFAALAASREAITNLENTNRRKDGRRVVLETSGIPFFDGAGNLRGYRGIDRDITERKDIEEQILRLASDLQRRAADLATVNRELEAFSYSLSHDLKAPLACIYTSVQALEDMHSRQLDENGRFFIDSIHKASARMEELLDAMLQLARVTRSELQYEKFDLSGIAREILLQLRMEQPERKVEWAIAPAIPVTGDPRLLRSALENLLGNAWKYTRHTERPFIEFGTVEMRNAECGGRDENLSNSEFRIPKSGTVYFVRDNGAGFPMEKVPQLFQPFHRLHQGGEFEGTGVGLATVQRIIHRHGGRIWGEGEVGKGATFYFTLGEAETA